MGKAFSFAAPELFVRDEVTGDLWWYQQQDGTITDRFVVEHLSWGLTGFGVGDWNGDGAFDLLLRDDGSGTLLDAPAPDFGNFQIGIGWNGFTSFGLGDWNSDGHVDVVARNDASGDLWMYPGIGGSYFGPRVRPGTGWT